MNLFRIVRKMISLRTLSDVENDASRTAQDLRQEVTRLASMSLPDAEKELGVTGHNGARPTRLGYGSQALPERKPLSARDRRRIEKILHRP